MVNFLQAFKLEKSVLMVMDNSDVNVLRACSNIKAVSNVPAVQLNTYDVVKNAKVVISQKAVEQLVQKLEEVK